jgi:hypothetical protein
MFGFAPASLPKTANLRRTGRRRALGRAASFAAIGLILSSQAAWADDISNNIDATVDAAAEVMALTVGGTDGATTLRVITQNGDGKNGCNLTGSSSFSASVASSSPTVASVNPSSVTFTSCGETKVLTVHPISAGSTTVSLTQTGNTTEGSFDLAPATFTVNVSAPPPANTPPTVTVTGVTHGSTYEIGSVPTVGCFVADAQDGNPVVTPMFAPETLPFGIGNQTATCSYTDSGGLTATTSATYTVEDTGAPIVTATATPAANGNGWNNTDVTVSYDCTDTGGSGVDAAASDLADDVLSASGTASGTCVDNAGNSASDSIAVLIDKDAPIVIASADPAANGNGWNNTDVTVSYDCTDTAGSGVDAAASDLDDDVLSASGTAEGTCVDNAGNSASDSIDVLIDKVAPTVAWSGSINDGDSFFFGSVPVEPTCDAVDDLSGPAGCTVTGYSQDVGTHTLEATATDVAGNSTTASRTYTVKAWTVSGFYAPVDRGIHNNVKTGATVPLKFEVFAGPTELTNTSVVSTFTQKIACASGVGDDIEQYATGSTSLRYDTSAGQFIFNWKTPSQKGACYRVTMVTNDGSPISADFSLK